MFNPTIVGGGWVTAAGFGQMNIGGKPQVVGGEPVLPKAKEIFTQPLNRYGRFDNYTKLGVAAIALALRDSALDEVSEKRNIGVVLSTGYECLGSDIEFYKSTLEEDGFYSSPNLFSYTLPGIVIGESAIHFKLTGPTFTLGENKEKGLGLTALETAIDLLQDGQCETIVVGWLDYPPLFTGTTQSDSASLKGAVFVVLSSDDSNRIQKKISYQNEIITIEQEKEISSILELF